MKDLIKIIRRYVGPYKGYLGGSVLLNILSAVFNIFSFSLLAPILKILFESGETNYEFIPWDRASGFPDMLNNLYYFITEWIKVSGASHVLLLLCLLYTSPSPRDRG